MMCSPTYPSPGCRNPSGSVPSTSKPSDSYSFTAYETLLFRRGYFVVLLAHERWIQPHERVVIFNTGAAQKYPEVMAGELPRIDKDAPLDWDRIAAGS